MNSANSYINTILYIQFSDVMNMNENNNENNSTIINKNDIHEVFQFNKFHERNITKGIQYILSINKMMFQVDKNLI